MPDFGHAPPAQSVDNLAPRCTGHVVQIYAMVDDLPREPLRSDADALLQGRRGTSDRADQTRVKPSAASSHAESQ